jgi:hypothetical protein
MTVDIPENMTFATYNQDNRMLTFDGINGIHAGSYYITITLDDGSSVTTETIEIKISTTEK